MECVICLEVVNSEEARDTLNCNHAFHTECITMWKKEKEECPVCRTAIPSDDLETAAQTTVIDPVNVATERLRIPDTILFMTCFFNAIIAFFTVNLPFMTWSVIGIATTGRVTRVTSILGIPLIFTLDASVFILPHLTIALQMYLMMRENLTWVEPMCARGVDYNCRLDSFCATPDRYAQTCLAFPGTCCLPCAFAHQ